MHPGPIDNSSLKGEHEDELKSGLIEGRDFALLPNSVADHLFTKYKVHVNVTYLRRCCHVSTGWPKLSSIRH